MTSAKALPPSLQELIESARTKLVPKGQIILYQDDIPHEAYIIKSGVVKIHNIDAQGNEKILHLLTDLAVIPLAFFSGGGNPTTWFYTALDETELYVVSKEKLQHTIGQDSASAIYLMNWFSSEMHELLVRLDSLGKTNVHDKLIAVLNFLVACHSSSVSKLWNRVHFPVNHQLLADMIGMTRESTATAMKEMADEKVVRNPQLTVLEINQAKLAQLSS